MLGLRCAVQHYDWGSTTHLPELLGHEPDGRPYAELWMGVHESAPSQVLSIEDGRLRRDSAGEPLGDHLARTPLAVLGQDVVARFGERLPYLFKVLAVARPLSLQVHPDAARAAEGWAREEAAGLPRTAPQRSFRDGEHKPELVVALTRFEALSGFRHPARVLELLEGLTGTLAERLRDRLVTGLAEHGPSHALKAGFTELLGPASPEDVAGLVDSVGARVRAGSPSPRADETVLRLAHWFPGDPGAAAALFLNRVTLEPGEAMYVPSGAPHAYLEGCALEAMACSDNVLRAGLTGKHIDRAALLACTVYEPDGARVTTPDVLTPEAAADDAAQALHRVYRTPAREFAVVVSDVPTGGVTTLPADGGPRILLCLEGDLQVAAATGEAVRLGHGDVVLLTADDGAAQASGQGRLATAFVPAEPVGTEADGAG